MKESIYKSYDELPLFLNSELVAKVLGVSPSNGCEADCRTQPSRTAGSAHGSDARKQRQELFLSAQ